MHTQLFQQMVDNVLPFGGKALFYPGLFTQQQSNNMLAGLQNEILWKQEPITIFGKTVMQPRLTACYGERAVGYSGIVIQVHPWTDLLLAIKAKVEEVCGCTFNSVLLNNYRNGQDSMGWHRDNEPELGRNPAIASVTFGAARKFLLRTYSGKDNKIAIELTNGSLLFMAGECQHVWEHSVPKIKYAGPRINLTFRHIY